MIILNKEIVYSYEKSDDNTYSLIVTENGKLAKTIHNLFNNKADAENFVNLVNKYELSPVHLDSFIEDFFTD